MLGQVACTVPPFEELLLDELLDVDDEEDELEEDELEEDELEELEELLLDESS